MTLSTVGVLGTWCVLNLGILTAEAALLYVRNGTLIRSNGLSQALTPLDAIAEQEEESPDDGPAPVQLVEAAAWQDMKLPSTGPAIGQLVEVEFDDSSEDPRPAKMHPGQSDSVPPAAPNASAGEDGPAQWFVELAAAGQPATPGASFPEWPLDQSDDWPVAVFDASPVDGRLFEGLAALNATEAGLEGLAELTAGSAGSRRPVKHVVRKWDMDYAFEKYPIGTIVEARERDGHWVPVGIMSAPQAGAYDIHVAKDFPGYDLPGVPSTILRRRLELGEADFLADNSQLKSRLPGLSYRRSKNVEDISSKHVPWGLVVIGEDEEDGWLRTANGYLPLVDQNATVLVKMEPRKPTPPPEDLDLGQTDKLPVFDAGEYAEFNSTDDGKSYLSRIAATGWHSHTYHIAVHRSGHSSPSLLANVAAHHLGRIKARESGPRPYPAPDCKRFGCVRLQVNTAEGRHFVLQLSQQDRLAVMMKMVCGKQGILWESCETNHTFLHRGVQLDPSTNVSKIKARDWDGVHMGSKASGRSNHSSHRSHANHSPH